MNDSLYDDGSDQQIKDDDGGQRMTSYPSWSKKSVSSDSNSQSVEIEQSYQSESGQGGENQNSNS